MKCLIALSAAVLMACTAELAFAAEQPAHLTCEVGPLHRQFGGTSWLVYSCDDDKSLVVASEASNPASPFVFVIAWTDTGYAVSGEGNGSRDASDAALRDLRALSRDQIIDLLNATRATARPPER